MAERPPPSCGTTGPVPAREGLAGDSSTARAPADTGNSWCGLEIPLEAFICLCAAGRQRPLAASAGSGRATCFPTLAGTVSFLARHRRRHRSAHREQAERQGGKRQARCIAAGRRPGAGSGRRPAGARRRAGNRRRRRRLGTSLPVLSGGRDMGASGLGWAANPGAHATADVHRSGRLCLSRLHGPALEWHDDSFSFHFFFDASSRMYSIHTHDAARLECRRNVAPPPPTQEVSLRVLHRGSCRCESLRTPLQTCRLGALSSCLRSGSPNRRAVRSMIRACRGAWASDSCSRGVVPAASDWLGARWLVFAKLSTFAATKGERKKTECRRI